jgi:hypothetical protein
LTLHFDINKTIKIGVGVGLPSELKVHGSRLLDCLAYRARLDYAVIDEDAPITVELDISKGE